jgi:pimeloyl-ACP methyl ester carboxylesterase
VNRRDLTRAMAGVALFGAGLLTALPTEYRERTFVFETGGCRLDTSVIESKTGSIHGSVVLLPGLAANKKIMSYVARGFAAQNLRVIVPDLPGHGRTPGPFSAQRAEQCTFALLQDLFARGLAQPDTLVLAGHSMGAAIALRLAEKVRVAGTIAIAPAPMRAAHGAQPEAILFNGPPDDPRNMLVLSGQFELGSMRGNAADLVRPQSGNSSTYEVIPGATHTSLIFDPRVVRRSQAWAARLLKLGASEALPSRLPLLASLVGFVGVMLIAGPFLREATRTEAGEATDAEPRCSGPFFKAIVMVAAASLAAVGILRAWSPFYALRIFEGDYLAGFLLIVSVALLTAKRPTSASSVKPSPKLLLQAAFAGLMVLLLVTGWFELTLSEAWLNAARWARFPFFVLVVLPYHLAEELLLGSPQRLAGWRRVAAGLSLRLIAWVAILIGIFYFHSGEVLLALLAPYFALLSVLQRRAMDIVRMGTGSAAAAALFGAILLAGFCLVIFPVT